jgi:drug/metabolite transporter (DMT)-like permease
MEPLNRRSLAGAAIALGGIVVMTVGPSGLIIPLSGLLAIALAVLILGESVIIGKKVSLSHPIVTNAAGMPIGAAGLILISLVAGETWVLPRQTSVVWAVVYLATLGSVGLFGLFLLVIRRWTPSATSYAFVLFPVVALVLEAAILDEPLTTRSVLGALIVMSGVWFGALAPGARSARERAEQDRIASTG